MEKEDIEEIEKNGWEKYAELPYVAVECGYSDAAWCCEDELAEKMKMAYKYVLESDGVFEEPVYLTRDNGVYIEHDGEDRDVPFLKPWDAIPFYTVRAACFNWKDFADEEIPEDPEAQSEMREKVIEALVDDFDPYPIIEYRIKEIEQTEISD